jgi:hypothetical protein
MKERARGKKDSVAAHAYNILSPVQYIDKIARVVQ